MNELLRHTLDLNTNQIGDTGAQELAKVLPNTQIHTLDLYLNQIDDSEMQQLLRQKIQKLGFLFSKFSEFNYS